MDLILAGFLARLQWRGFDETRPSCPVMDKIKRKQLVREPSISRGEPQRAAAANRGGTELSARSNYP